MTTLVAGKWSRIYRPPMGELLRHASHQVGVTCMVVMGVSGAGESTVAAEPVGLSDRDLAEGDHALAALSREREWPFHDREAPS